jgi:hypothetical protein
MTSRHPATVRRAVAVPAALVLAVAGISACSDDTTGPEAGVTVEDIAGTAEENEIGLEEGDIQEFEQYLGETVTVSADLNQVIDDRAFTIGRRAAETQELLVLTPVDRELLPGTTVRVTGEVGTFVFDELSQEEASWMLEVGEAQWTAFDGEPYVAATAVEELP